MEIEKRKINEYFLVFFVFLLYFFALLKLNFLFDGIKNAPILAAISTLGTLLTFLFTYKLLKISKFAMFTFFMFQIILDVSIIIKSGKTSYSVFTLLEVMLFYYMYVYSNKVLHLPYFMPKTPFFASESNMFIPKLTANIELNNIVLKTKVTELSESGCYLFANENLPKCKSLKITLEFNNFSCTMISELRSSIISKKGYGFEFTKTENSNDSFLELSNLINNLRRTGYVD